MKPTANGPIFQETQLGWVVSGPVMSENIDKENARSYRYHAAEISMEDNLEKMVLTFRRIWDEHTIENM